MIGVYASNLERILAELSETADAAPQERTDMEQRFNSLRSYGRLPQGREQRALRLSNLQVADAILGLAAIRPGWAGHTASVLGGFLPVGGPSASIDGTPSLKAALGAIIGDETLRNRLVRVSLSMAEAGVNSNGWAEIVLNEEEGIRHIGFVSQLAVSLLQPGAERGFDPASRFSMAARTLVLPRRFFDRLADLIEHQAGWPAPAGDGSEYNEDDARRARMKALDVRRLSRFLNIGVDTQATWPRDERLVKFDDYTVVMMPKTKDTGPSVHIDLYANKLSAEQAMTVINRFLSVQAWCSDQFAISQGGWSGNPVPVAVPRRDLAFATATHWLFNRKIPATDEARRALAHYREALNAEEASLVSYAVLSYFKVLELRHDGGPKIKRWIASQMSAVRPTKTTDDILNRFDKDRGATSPEEYLWESGRLATAHASFKHPSDADLSQEVGRLQIAARIMRRLARHFIRTELGVETSPFSGT